VGVLDLGVPRTPAQARAALRELNAPNPQVFKSYEQAVESRIAELTGPIVQGARDSLAAMNDELAELIQAATGHDEALEALRRRIKRREITTKDARKERDRIRREEMKLSQLLDSITAAHEREVYVRDHPEDVLNVLYDRYPALPRPQFPI
jgi:Skp family chaperone for outer membrane proteins